jgi:glutamate synthase domain-containing protein 1
MFGIAARILSKSGLVGVDLVKLMEAQRHRGADSTGFAMYGPGVERGFIVRAMVSSRRSLSDDLQAFEDILIHHGSALRGEPSHDESDDDYVSVRMLIEAPDSMSQWVRDADGISDRIEIQSVGKSLEIVKDLGGAREVADKHGLRDFVGTHGLGHARLATESTVSPTASHPFWARPFPDVAIVHNGQITDYFTWRDRLRRHGYRFMTENDSELLAVWISDRMSRGMTLGEALKLSIGEIDGVFTFLISDRDTLGFAKDRFAMKPLVAVEEGDLSIAVATEEQAVRTVYADEMDVINYDGPSLTRTWSTHAPVELAA